MMDPPNSRIGEVIDEKFTLREILGRGGMAEVYLADQHSMDRQVAIKLLHRTPITNQNNIRRFMREAKAVSKLSHPNIVKVFDFGTTESGEMYLVMEYLKGAPLHDILAREKTLHPTRAARLLSQVCEGLSEAHQHGVVHRDLTPSNIFVARSGDGKDEFCTVLDFGIAHTQIADGTTKLTLTGAVLGTPQYMSPEQTMGEDITAQSDVYSMGIVLYEMLTGAPPFQHAAVGRVLVSHINASPKPFDRSQLQHDIPASLEALVMQMLSKAPADRPPTSLAVKTLLRQAFDQNDSVYDEQVGSPVPDTSEVAFAPTLNLTPAEENPIINPTLAFEDSTGTNDSIANSEAPAASEEMIFNIPPAEKTTSQGRTFGWFLAAAALGLATFLVFPQFFSDLSPAENPSPAERLQTPPADNPIATVELLDIQEADGLAETSDDNPIDGEEEGRLASDGLLLAEVIKDPETHETAAPLIGLAQANPQNDSKDATLPPTGFGIFDFGSSGTGIGGGGDRVDIEKDKLSTKKRDPIKKEDRDKDRNNKKMSKKDKEEPVPTKTSPIKVKMNFSNGTVDGFCEVSDIRKKLLRRKESFKTCHYRLQKSGETPLGTIKIGWQIDEIGRVKTLKILNKDNHSEPLARCLRSKIQSLRFTRPNSGTCEVDWAFSFTP